MQSANIGCLSVSLQSAVAIQGLDEQAAHGPEAPLTWPQPARGGQQASAASVRGYRQQVSKDTVLQRTRGAVRETSNTVTWARLAEKQAVLPAGSKASAKLDWVPRAGEALVGQSSCRTRPERGFRQEDPWQPHHCSDRVAQPGRMPEHRTWQGSPPARRSTSRADASSCSHATQHPDSLTAPATSVATHERPNILCPSPVTRDTADLV